MIFRIKPVIFLRTEDLLGFGRHEIVHILGFKIAGTVQRSETGAFEETVFADGFSEPFIILPDRPIQDAGFGFFPDFPLETGIKFAEENRFDFPVCFICRDIPGAGDFLDLADFTRLPGQDILAFHIVFATDAVDAFLSGLDQDSGDSFPPILTLDDFYQTMFRFGIDRPDSLSVSAFPFFFIRPDPFINFPAEIGLQSFFFNDVAGVVIFERDGIMGFIVDPDQQDAAGGIHDFDSGAGDIPIQIGRFFTPLPIFLCEFHAGFHFEPAAFVISGQAQQRFDPAMFMMQNMAGQFVTVLFGVFHNWSTVRINIPVI